VRVRVRRLVAAAGALVVAGALAWPQPPSAVGTALPAPAFPWPGSYVDSAFVGVTVRFRPVWLPFALSQRPLTATLRTVIDSTTEQFIWSVAPVDEPDSTLTLTVHRLKVADEVPGLGGVRMDVNGQPGVYHPGQSRTALDWRIDTTFVATLEEQGLHIAAGDLVAMAASVRPERVPKAVPVMRLPSVQWADGELLGDSQGGWLLRAYVAPDGAEEGDVGAPVLLEIGTSTDAPAGGTPVTVDGRPARLVGTTKVKYLVTQSAAGQTVTVIGSGDLASWPARLTDVVPPDLTWLVP
jgi:hypothetical protein